MESDPKNYELAYLLSPSVLEEEILTQAGQLTKLIEDAKGVVKHVEEPKKRKLSYAINKEKIAYFGWTTFRTTPENVAGLDKKMKGQAQVIRYLIVEEDMNARPMSFRTFSPKSPAAQKAQAAAHDTPEEKLDLEALDKKLEEILGK